MKHLNHQRKILYNSGMTGGLKMGKKRNKMSAEFSGMSEEELNECIRKTAYELWEQSGCAGGRDLEFWAQAEKKIKGKA